MNSKLLYWLIPIVIIYLINIMIAPMEADSSQYASMSMEMLERGNFLNVYDYGRDYLDKPPFLFWINSLSMYVFGANLFAFKLPSLLFAILAIFSTYKLAGILYNKHVAILSSLVLASSQCLFLITNDIRTDTILMGWVIFSLWQLISWFQTKRLINFILGFAAIGGGMLTKGPIAIFVPVFALGSHILVHRKFSLLLRWEYFAGLLIIAIVLLPMSIGLYQQFDLHPEKLVSNKYHVSGLRFFYWTQSFGRITGESIWKNNVGFFYLLQGMLWSFLPWIIFFLIALFLTLKKIIIRIINPGSDKEVYTAGGFLLTYTALALSAYQLPHYIFVVFPLAAIITGNFLYQLFVEKRYPNLNKILSGFHSGLFALLWVGAVYLVWNVFDSIPFYARILVAICFAGYLFLLFKSKILKSAILILCLYTITGINFFLSSFFYPALLKFQTGNEVGKYYVKQQLPVNNLYIFKAEDRHSLSFFTKAIIPEIKEVTGISPGNYVLAGEKGMHEIDSAAMKYKVLKSGGGYRVSSITNKFLDPETREKVLQKYYLIRLD